MADRQFIVEAIFRAQDQLSRVLQTIQGNAQNLGTTLSSGSIANAGKALDTVAVRAQNLQRSLSSGNFKGAATDIDAVSRSVNQLAAALSAGDLSGAARSAANLGAAFTSAALPAATLAKEFERVKGLGIASADGLLAIQGAATSADISLKVVASGLTNFRARVISAQEGTGRAAAALRTLGASTEQIKSGFGGTAQALTFVSSRLAVVSDETERALLASRLFGQAGQQLVPILGSLASAESAVAVSSEAMGASLLPVVAIVATVVAAIAGLIVAVKTVQGVVGAGIEGAVLADQLGDIAEKTGTTTEEISRLAFAASQSDTSIQAVASSMKFLARNIQEARQEGSEARLNFLALGFSAKEIDSGTLTARDALLRMADAIASIDDPIARTTLTTKLLGRSADEMVPFLARGSAGIRALGDEADRMRATVSSAQSEVGDKFTKSVAALNLQMDELKAQLAQGVIPAFTDFVKAASEAVIGAEALRDRVGELATAFGVMNGVDSEKFFDGIAQAVASLIPGLNEVVTLMNFIKGFAPPKAEPEKRGKAFEDVKTGKDVSLTAIDFEKNRAGLKSEAKAHEEAAAAAKKHAEELVKLRAAYDKAIEGANNLDVPREAARIFFELDPASAPKAIESLQAAIDDMKKEAENAKIIVPVGIQFQKPKLDDFGKLPGPATIPFADQEPKEVDRGRNRTGEGDLSRSLIITNTESLKLIQTFEDMGIPVDHLKESLAVIGNNLTAMGEIGVAVGAALEESFSEAFDPLKVGIEGTAEAVFNLRQGFDNAFSTLERAILSGQTGFIKLASVIKGAILMVGRFVIELGFAIAKALILKAITGGLFAGGGGVSKTVTNDHPWGLASGGPVARFASGGSVSTALGSTAMRIQRFASGGGIGAHFTSPIFAASGLAIPGGPNRMDNVPIWASQGEFVLPNLGPTSGVDIARSLAGGLDAIKDVLKHVGRQEEERGWGGGPPLALHIHANDADSVRNAVRPGGSFEKQLARAAELGR